MESLGQYLRKLREERGLSLEDVAQDTKLRKRYLEALEADQFEKLPAEVYVKPFLKTYAQCLAIDREELYSRYQAQRSPAPSDLVSAAARRPVLRPGWLSLGAVSLLVLVVALVLSTSGEKEAGPKAPLLKEETGDLNSGSVSDGSRVDSAVAEGNWRRAETVPGRSLSDKRVAAPVPRTGMRLKVTADDTSWLEVVGDEDTLFYGFILRGEQKEFEARNHFILTAGKPEEIRFFLDGEPLSLPLGSSRTIYQLKLERSRVSKYIAGR